VPLRRPLLLSRLVRRIIQSQQRQESTATTATTATVATVRVTTAAATVIVMATVGAANSQAETRIRIYNVIKTRNDERANG